MQVCRSFSSSCLRVMYFSGQCLLSNLLNPVRSTRDVAKIVVFDHEIATPRSDALDTIRQLVQDRNAVEVADLSSLRRGHVVCFCNTALSGIDGLVKSVSSHCAAVLLEFMGHPRMVSVDHRELEAA